MPRSALQRTVKTMAASVDRVRGARHGAVVLIYHRVGGRSGLEIDLGRGLFQRQCEELAASGRVMTLDAALDVLGGEEPPAEDPVVLTFDDGTADFVDVALPVLERFRLPATIYVATGFVEEQRLFPNDGTPLSWTALQDALRTGLVTVGSHTHSHALLDRLPAGDIDAELDESRRLIEDRLGVSADHFAYPKAVAGSAAAEAAVRARFRSAALAGTRPNPWGRTDLHRLSRSPIQVSDGMRWFRHKLAGGMALEDALRRIVNRRRYGGVTT